MWMILGVVATLAVAAFVVIGFTQPRAIVRWLHGRHDDVFYYVDSTRRAVALTIDDGPSADHTSAILDALARHGAHATFFLLGERAQRHPNGVRRMRAEGHEPANHFFSDRPTILLGEERLGRHLLATERAIVAALERAEGANHPYNESGPRWCRPGFGWYNRRVLRAVRRYGYRVALGSVYPHDTKLRSESLIARIILGRVRPGDIIVLHDRAYVPGVLDRILPALDRRGITVTTLSDLAGA